MDFALLRYHRERSSSWLLGHPPRQGLLRSHSRVNPREVVSSFPPGLHVYGCFDGITRYLQPKSSSAGSNSQALSMTVHFPIPTSRTAHDSSCVQTGLQRCCAIPPGCRGLFLHMAYPATLRFPPIKYKLHKVQRSVFFLSISRASLHSCLLLASLLFFVKGLGHTTVFGSIRAEYIIAAS